MKRSLRSFSLATLTLLLASAIAWAQATAQLNGRVTDESGAVLPGVTVTATQTDTRFTRTVVTDETGAWVMPNVPIGPYQLAISLQGFRTYVQTGIVLQVNANPVINASLAVGNLTETVTVEGATPLVDVRSAGISEVVEQARIVELPLNGRQVTDLIVLAGGAVNTGRVSALSTSNAVAISVAGGLRNGVEYQLDGAMHNSMHDNANLPFPFPDALQEFSVATGGLSAQNGSHSSAAVNAVTKSGTNAFHGNLFEFLRDSRFNEPGVFAPLDRETGEKRGDGLNRNVFGGTLGGPLVRDKLFFFGGVERQRSRQVTPDNRAFVPTAAMLAGDFTAPASGACRTTGPLTLRAPFVNNRIDPAQYSQAAMKIATSGWLPTTTDPCGEVFFSAPSDSNQTQYVARVDYQLSPNQSLFARYINTQEDYLPQLERTHNVLVLTQEFNPKRSRRAHTTAVGLTQVFGANTVNAIRGTYVNTATLSNIPAEQFFDAASLGIPGVYPHAPGVMAVAVTSAFSFSGNNNSGAIVDTRSYQASDDFSRVVGRHQLDLGTSVSYSTYDGTDITGSVGTFNFTGQVTGLALADFLTGRMLSFGQGSPVVTVNNRWYIGVYGSDTWRVTDRVTLNLGVRWEPYLGNNFVNDTIVNFSLDNFHNGVTSTQFVNAPAGLLYPGDPGFPPGNTGFYKKWWNLSPRLGAAWDVRGDGRTAVRSSYAINYDFPGAAAQQSAANAPPFGGGVNVSGDILFDDPYRGVPGGSGQPWPLPPPRDVAFPSPASYSAVDPDINSIRVQSWNVTVEQQIAEGWQVSASYLGSYIDRIWGPDPINAGVFLGLGPCTLHGVSYPVCSTTANLQARRALRLENPRDGQHLASMSLFKAIGEQTYRGLKLSFRGRTGFGVNVGGNFTVSKCVTDSTYDGRFIQGVIYNKPGDISYDLGNCPNNRRQIANITIGAQSPQFSNAVLRVLASDWRMSGIVSAQTGSWLTVTTARDLNFTGIGGQRVNQVNDNPYGDKTLDNYLNPAAFAYPAPGTYGDQPARGIEGPGRWNVDTALARVLRMGARTFELRVEAFNLLNHFNWGNPSTNLDAGTFGQISSQAGDSRVMQFAVKYGF